MHLYELATAGKFEGGFKPFKDTIIQAIEQAEAAHKRDGKLAGVTTGFRDMDSLLGGLHKSDLLILAGRPAMGKQRWRPTWPSMPPTPINKPKARKAPLSASSL